MIKKLLFGISTMLVLAVGGLAVSPPAHAAGAFGTSDANYVPAGHTVDGAAYYYGNSVRIEGTVNGDVYCAASDVVITGTVNGDIYCAGSSVTIAGKVNGNVRVAGSSVTLRGVISGSATAFGSSITVETTAKIGRDAVFTGGDVLMNGLVGRDVVMVAQTGTIDGTVGRDVEGTYGNLRVPSDAVIGGFLHYTSDTNATITGTVKGGVVRHAAESSTTPNTQVDVIGGAVLFMALMALWTLLVALALALVLPKKMSAVTTVTTQGAILSIAIGLAALVAVPILAVVLISSVIALPLGIAMLVGWIALCTVSAGITAIYLGRVLWGNRRVHPLIATTLAALILGVSFVIPFLNIITIVGSLAFGAGAVLYALRSEYPSVGGDGPRVKLAGKR